MNYQTHRRAGVYTKLQGIRANAEASLRVWPVQESGHSLKACSRQEEEARVPSLVVPDSLPMVTGSSVVV